jgi:hypothetical protein
VYRFDHYCLKFLVQYLAQKTLSDFLQNQSKHRIFVSGMIAGCAVALKIMNPNVKIIIRN